MSKRGKANGILVHLITTGAILAVATLAMATGGEKHELTPPQTTPVVANEAQLPSTEIISHSRSFFAAPPFMVAEEVYGKIVKGGDPSFFLVSLQSRDGFAQGHIPGAVNIPFPEISEAPALARLPHDKTIVFTCDDGHRSAAATLYLTQLGYRAAMLGMGLSHWNGAAAKIAMPYPGSAGFPVSSENVTTTATYPLPELTAPSGDAQETISARTAAVLHSGRSLVIDGREIYEQAVKKGDPGYFLVSLQRPEDYAQGHVPGAINIPYTELTQPENLKKLPPDQKIILICYIGHYAGAGALFLNQLGYQAYDMRFGTLGWNDTTDGLGPVDKKAFLVGLGKSLDLPIVKN